MNTKTLLIVLGVLIALAALAFAFVPRNTVQAPASEEAVQTSLETPVTVTPTEAAATVTLTDEGFSPSTVTVNVGDTVRFVNTSSRGMWVGADEHPTHTEYDGTSTREHCEGGVATNGTFDQCTSVDTGTYWEYTFTKAGTFGYHNHVGASSEGTIIVE